MPKAFFIQEQWLQRTAPMQDLRCQTFSIKKPLIFLEATVFPLWKCPCFQKGHKLFIIHKCVNPKCPTISTNLKRWIRMIAKRIAASTIISSTTSAWIHNKFFQHKLKLPAKEHVFPEIQ